MRELAHSIAEALDSGETSLLLEKYQVILAWLYALNEATVPANLQSRRTLARSKGMHGYIALLERFGKLLGDEKAHVVVTTDVLVAIWEWELTNVRLALDFAVRPPVRHSNWALYEAIRKKVNETK